jgi:UDP-N-acetylmuramoylalanine--D-glutamate ligase
MNIDGIKKVCVIGWGKSGTAACDLLLSLKKSVTVIDDRQETDLDKSTISRYRKKEVRFFFQDRGLSALEGVDLVVLSPGVDTSKHPIAAAAKAAGIFCVGEIELASWFTESKIVAITGTNGKTTTTHLTYKLLKEGKRRVFIGGNMGIPFSSFVRQTKKNDIVVLEVSSFQMESIVEFRPHVAALLNIEPDHMDRYGDFNRYVLAKENIFRNQKEEDWAILNKNALRLRSLEARIRSQIVYFSDEFDNENFSCVYRIGKIFGFSKVDCLSFFSKFKGLPHRLEFVKKVRGVTFINDSKATNPASTVWALKSFKKPVILLAGGKDKGLDYSCLRPFSKSLKRVYVFGQAAGAISSSLAPGVRCRQSAAMEEALAKSFEEAAAGDVILLSPMCASFDAFIDYEHRGRRFIEIVNSF